MSTGAHSSRRRRARSPGRPPVDAEADIRSALLEAAKKLFLKHGFERVTARQIAASAGTTAAMIHYYFGNKLGLFRAMIERVIAPLRSLLVDSLAEPGASPDPARLMGMQMRAIAENPWLPTFVLNEVLAEKGRFRSTFVRDVASQQAPLVIELLERGRASGRFRPDIEPRFAALTLLSLCLFPFLSRPVSGPVLGIKLEGEELERFIAHTVKIFLHGIENRS
jgi:AcrR family transcriptional regulator